jgi:hypothetical protein
LLCNQTSDHEDFVKFGYRPDMKIEKNLTILLYFDHLLKPVVEIWFSVGRDRIWQVVAIFISRANGLPLTNSLAHRLILYWVT